MARAKLKLGYQLDHDILPETSPDILQKIIERCNFEIPQKNKEELAHILDKFNAGRKHETLKNRPKKRDVVRTLNEVAKVCSRACEIMHSLDDETKYHLIEDIDDIYTAARKTASIAAIARHKADELQKEIDKTNGGREKGIDFPFVNLVIDLAEFYTKVTKKRAAANYSENYLSAKSPKKTEPPFVRFVRACLEVVEPDFLRSHSNPSSIGYLIREILKTRRYCHKIINI